MVMIPNLLLTGIESSSLENLQKSTVLHQVLFRNKFHPFSNYYCHQFQPDTSGVFKYLPTWLILQSQNI